MDLIHSQNDFCPQILHSPAERFSGGSDPPNPFRNSVRDRIIESALDDPEHISTEGYPEKLMGIVQELLIRLKKLLESAEDGRLLKEGIRTVIVGKPNVGKSSLLNLLVGEERAIVTDVEGTTRDALEESVRLGGISLNIVDTGGIRDAKDVVEKIGVQRARKYAQDAELILYVVILTIPG